MRINGAYGTNGTASAPATRRAKPSGFTLPQEETSNAPASAAGHARGIGGIDALLALQSIEDPTERRRRAVIRGRSALDTLEELKLGLLAGTLNQETLSRLKTVAAGLKNSSGDRNLDGVLAEIDLRVEVELAKMGSDRPA
jgi:hypothetical protein